MAVVMYSGSKKIMWESQACLLREWQKKNWGSRKFFGAVYKYVNISMDVFVLGS